MRTLCEAHWLDTDGEEPRMMKDKYYLLHFGLKMDVINGVGVSYTVAICQHYETGQLEIFDPQNIRIIGTEIKK